MSDDFLPFSKPSISDEAIAEVVACLKSGWITTGPRTARFAELLQDYFPTKHALTVSSGTAGLHLALLGLDLSPGDEVITSSLTFVASLNTIVQAGGKPVLVDINPNTRNMDVNLLEAAITPKTRAIMPVHFAGQPVDLEPLYEIAKKHNLRVIEDAAQAIGSEYHGKRIGSFGDTQVFSFHPNKNLTTGEGGCVTTTDDELAKHISVMRFHGIDRDAFNRFSKDGSQAYDVIAPGHKYNMLDMQAALGIHQLPALETFIEKRTALAMRYYEKLGEIKALSLPECPPKDVMHNWHLFTVYVDPKIISRDDFMLKLKENNIGSGLHYEAVHLYSYYQKNYGFKVGDFPHAERASKEIVSLPLFPDMTTDEQDRVIQTIKQITQ